MNKHVNLRLVNRLIAKLHGCIIIQDSHMVCGTSTHNPYGYSMMQLNNHLWPPVQLEEHFHIDLPVHSHLLLFQAAAKQSPYGHCLMQLHGQHFHPGH